MERDGENVVVRIPMKLKKRGGRKGIIVPEGLEAAAIPRSPTQEPLVIALARAFHWQDLLDNGRYGSITELAEALGVDRSHVRRILNLACLAPDIVGAIVEGKEPSGLSLERPTKGVPMLWEEQRVTFGFAGAMATGRRTTPRG